MQLLGLHHVSAIASSGSDCRDFYGGLLELEQVSRFGADELAFGTDREGGGGVLSFEVSPGAARGNPGRGLVHRLQWSVPRADALEPWRRRLEAAGVSVTAWLSGSGDPLALRFADPDGLEHELTLPPAFVLSSPPREQRTNADLVLTGVRAYAAGSVPSGDLLAGRLGFEACGQGVWRVGGGAEAVRYECERPPPSRPVEGAGSVRHVAWACRPGEERAWRQRVIGMGATVSPVIECDGYRCFFFREPDGVLFGVATLRRAAAPAQLRFEPPRPAAIPPRIARPIGILAAV
ncbi:MAG TPA: VOC family protein [Solirubrobacterales bacterium]|nr:VOC family protein [Solirubrobacterales bacterium]